jgi:hypothetical protein
LYLKEKIMTLPTHKPLVDRLDKWSLQKGVIIEGNMLGDLIGYDGEFALFDNETPVHVVGLTTRNRIRVTSPVVRINLGIGKDRYVETANSIYVLSEMSQKYGEWWQSQPKRLRNMRG